MKKLRKDNEIVYTAKTETLEDFFARGKQTAKLLDLGEAITPQKNISFEDPDDLKKFLKTQTP